MLNKVFLFLTYGTLKILDFCPLKILNYVITKRGDNLSDKNCYLLRQLCFYDALQNLDRFLLFVIDFTFLLASLNNRHLLFYIIRKVSIMLPIFVLNKICPLFYINRVKIWGVLPLKIPCYVIKWCGYIFQTDTIMINNFASIMQYKIILIVLKLFVI